MGNYEQLKQSVSDVIKTNGNQEITGSILQNVLLTIISSVGANATFAGIATPTTNPGTPDGPVFYLASESGTYSNFGSIELQAGLSVLMWNGSWSSQQVFDVDDEPTVGSDNLVKSGGVQEELALGAVYDVSAKNPTGGSNNDGKWESLSALLSDANLNTLIPTAVRKGGMSIKFVQSSDNKYVQYRLMSQSFNTNIFNWIDDTEKIKELDYEINGVIINANINPTTGEIEQYNGRIISSNFYPITSQPTVGVYAGDGHYYETFLRYYDTNKSIIGSSYTSEAAFIKIVASISNSAIEKEDIIGLYCTINNVKTIFSMNDKIVDIKNQISVLTSVVSQNKETSDLNCNRLLALSNIININIEGKYINKNNGKIYSLSGYSISKNIAVKGGETIIYNGTYDGNACGIGYWGNGGFQALTITGGKAIIPDEGYIIACSETSNSANIIIYNSRIDNANSWITKKSVENIDITSAKGNRYINKDSGELASWSPSWGPSYYSTDYYIPVEEGDDWIYYGWVEGNAISIAFYNSNKEYVHEASLAWSTIGGWHSFSIPTNIEYMRVSSSIKYMDKPYVCRRTNKVLDEKKWTVIGDSISIAYAANTNNFYYDVIKNKFKNCIVSVFAVAGSRIAYNSGSTISFVQRIDEMIAADTNKDADFITLFGGVNDWGQEQTSTASTPIPLGSVDDAMPSVYTDATTFHKALKYICKQLISNYPKAKIIFMTPIGANVDSSVTTFANGENSLGFTIIDYRNAMKQEAEIYGIEVNDIGGEAGLTPLIQEQKDLYFIAYNIDNLGGLHPNPYGHILIAKQLEKSMM